MTKTFVSNLEQSLCGGSARGSAARKIRSHSPKWIWSGYDVLILPEAPDPDFLSYASDFYSVIPEIVVPEGIELDRLDILDGLSDPSMKDLLNEDVESYVWNAALSEIVSSHGGRYVGAAQSSETIERVNGKENYAQYIKGLAGVPEGVVRKGINLIADEVWDRLRRKKDVFVRLAHSGGGLGNRIFLANEPPLSITELKHFLEGDDPGAWRVGKALVEEILDLTSSPGLTFDTRSGFRYDFLQSTYRGAYRGNWSPVPEWLLKPEVLMRTAEILASRLKDEGYEGWASTDLGVTGSGQLVGFEINGRMESVRPNIELGQHLFGPWKDWRNKGIVTRSLDYLNLQNAMSFSNLYSALKSCGMLLDSRGEGAVITTPPFDRTAGVQIFTTNGNYQRLQELSNRVIKEVGTPMVEDHPLFGPSKFGMF